MTVFAEARHLLARFERQMIQRATPNADCSLRTFHQARYLNLNSKSQLQPNSSGLHRYRTLLSYRGRYLFLSRVFCLNGNTLMRFRLSTLILSLALICVVLGWVITDRRHRESRKNEFTIAREIYPGLLQPPSCDREQGRIRTYVDQAPAQTAADAVALATTAGLENVFSVDV